LVRSNALNDDSQKTQANKSTLKTRLHIGRFNAGMMYNQVMKISMDPRIVNETFQKGVITPSEETYIVIIDTTRFKDQTLKAIESIYSKKTENVGLCRIPTRVPSETVVIPTIKINFHSILDRPVEANKSLFGSQKKNTRIFADKDGINTASLQILDRYLSEAKKMKGIDYKMIVLHDDGLVFDDVKDFVHCTVDDFVATVASRVTAMKLEM